MDIDPIDRKIVAELTADGRLSYSDLAKRVALSPSQCLRRVKALEAGGVVRGYRAEVDNAALGFAVDLFFSVQLRIDDSSTLQAFESAVAEIPEVVECHCLLGEPDYLLRVLSRDLDSYQRLHADVLGRLPGISRLTSHVRVRAVKDRATSVTPTSDVPVARRPRRGRP